MVTGNLIFPFETDPDDHCESPLEAYEDIVPLLKVIVSSGGAAVRGGGSRPKSPSEVKIYDPYYCNGGMVRHLNQLGYPHVYNQMEDCYEVWKTPTRYPDFDVLLTNPPYSSDHIEALMRHLTAGSETTSSSLFPSDRPWMLLLPQWVHKKEYYVRATRHIEPFYIVPHKRYVYLPPPSFRKCKKSDTHKKSSPFVSMWYVWGGTRERNAQWLKISLATSQTTNRYDVARSKNALRDLRRKNNNNNSNRRGG
jgi:hypothetical protein